MQNIKACIIDFINREDGASALEYALMAVMVVVALMTIVPDISTQVKAVFNNILTAITPT